MHSYCLVGFTKKNVYIRLVCYFPVMKNIVFWICAHLCRQLADNAIVRSMRHSWYTHTHILTCQHTTTHQSHSIYLSLSSIRYTCNSRNNTKQTIFIVFILIIKCLFYTRTSVSCFQLKEMAVYKFPRTKHEAILYSMTYLVPIFTPIVM